MKLRTLNLAAFNSLTKYPSIPTYHPLDPEKRGVLMDPPVPFAGEVILTEKVDGTNTRIVCLPDGDFVIGSRGEFLHARGDLIHNPALGIVDAVRDAAEHIVGSESFEHVTVFYGEVFGGRVTRASPQYTSDRAVSFRLFDVAVFPDAEARLHMSNEAIAGWREDGGQAFVGEERLATLARSLDLKLAPRIDVVSTMPSSIEQAHAFLEARLPATRCALDEDAGGSPEGLVVRTPDRSRIAKLRFADYTRTQKQKRR